MTPRSDTNRFEISLRKGSAVEAGPATVFGTSGERFAAPQAKITRSHKTLRNSPSKARLRSARGTTGGVGVTVESGHGRRRSDTRGDAGEPAPGRPADQGRLQLPASTACARTPTILLLLPRSIPRLPHEQHVSRHDCQKYCCHRAHHGIQPQSELIRFAGKVDDHRIDT